MTPTPFDTIRTRLAFAFEAAETEEDRAWVNEGQEALALMEAEAERLRKALGALDEWAFCPDDRDPAALTDWQRGYKQAQCDGGALARFVLAQPGDAA